MLADSGLLNNLENYAFFPNGDQMCIYEDSAYPLRVHLQAPFRGTCDDACHAKFSRSMSTARVPVE